MLSLTSCTARNARPPVSAAAAYQAPVASAARLAAGHDHNRRSRIQSRPEAKNASATRAGNTTPTGPLVSTAAAAAGQHSRRPRAASRNAHQAIDPIAPTTQAAKSMSTRASSAERQTPQAAKSMPTASHAMPRPPTSTPSPNVSSARAHAAPTEGRRITASEGPASRTVTAASQ
jgi:hypothetical protein